MSSAHFRITEQVRLLYMQAPISNSVIIIISILYYLILRSRVQADLLFAWMVILIITSLYRFFLWNSWRRGPENRPAKSWYIYYLVGCALVGSAWSPIYFFAVKSADPFVNIVLMMLAFGVCSSAVPILSVSMPAFILYTYPQGLVLGITLAGFDDSLSMLLVVSIIIYFIMTTLFTFNTNRKIHESIDLQDENNTLINNLNNEVTAREQLVRERTRELEEKNIVLVAEVNERKKAEKELNNLNIELKATLQAIPDYLYEFNEKGKYLDLWVNSPNLIELGREKLIGHTVKEILPKEAADNVMASIAEAKIHGVSRGKNISLPSRSGLRWFELSTSRKKVSKMENHYLTLAREITDQKVVEDELMKVKKLESLGILAGGIAHDFNNILTAIAGNIELAKTLVTKDEKTLQLLNDAHKASMRATKLTQQLLTFSRGGAPVKEATSLNSLIREAAEFVLHGSQVTCKFDIPSDLWMVNADSGQVEQVIQNIILNSKDALPNGGTIWVKCSNIDASEVLKLFGKSGVKMVKISLVDKGVGIPKDIQDKIFDPYFTTKNYGHGLGLSICHTIIKKHDGYLQVNSSDEEGTTFAVYLPALVGVKDNLTKPVKTNSRVNGCQIMVVDDEHIIREVLMGQLTSLGHKVILAEHGEEAVDMFARHREEGNQIDLIIMDLTIPGGIGGVEATEIIRQLDSKVKIIVSSGYSNDPVMANHASYGFNSALAKPFEMDTLAKCIEDLL